MSTATRSAAWRRYAAGSEVRHFARFSAEHLIQSIDAWDGLPLKLEAFQTRLMGEALAFDPKGWPVWRSVVIVMPRKNGKTALLAAYAVYRLLTSDGSPEILLAASSDKQAGRLFDAAATFIRRSPVLSEVCRLRDYVGEIVREDGLGRILRMSSDPARLHGYSPSLVICDELAQWTTPMLKRAYAALTSGGGARQAPQVFTITTAGEAHTRHDSILGRILDEAAEAQDAERKPGLLVSRLWEASMLVWNYEAPTSDPRDVKAMKLANPASWITAEYLRRQAADPELSDADVLQLHGCVWAEGESAWLPASAFEQREDAEREVAEGEQVVLGFDGSYKRDATALIGCTLDGHLFVVEIWERPQHAGDDWKVPRVEVEAAIAEAMERYKVLELACDPPGWHAELDGWREIYGEVVLEYGTNERRRMAAACDRFRAGVLEGGLSYDGDKRLLRHISHCVAKQTPQGVLITKDGHDSPRKIDAAVAAVVAYDRAMWNAANREAGAPWVMQW